MDPVVRMTRDILAAEIVSLPSSRMLLAASIIRLDLFSDLLRSVVRVSDLDIVHSFEPARTQTDAHIQPTLCPPMSLDSKRWSFYIHKALSCGCSRTVTDG